MGAILGAISAIWQIIQALLGLWHAYQDQQEKNRVAEAERKRQEREKAVADLAKATTAEEKWDAQDRIIRNRP